jgi:hypothetical protein
MKEAPVTVDVRRYRDTVRRPATSVLGALCCRLIVGRSKFHFQ